MNADELKKELREQARKWWFETPEIALDFMIDELLVPIAEPREKQIQIDAEQIRALQKQNGELTDKVKELEAQIEKMKKYIKTCWVEENLNDYSSYMTNTSDEFRDLVKELNDEVRNGR